MKGLSNKIKIMILVGVFVVFAGGMFLFGYGIMAGRNQVIADSIAKSNVELEVLLREQKSFEQGKMDLASLGKSQYPPEELFSSDTKVVKEIQQLESIAQRYALEMSIVVSGSVKDAQPVEGSGSQLLAVPYAINLEGKFEDILMFTQALERTQFVTHANSISVEVAEDNLTQATIRSLFYIKK